MSVKVERIQDALWEENMPGGILGPIIHMFGTGDLSKTVVSECPGNNSYQPSKTVYWSVYS